MGDAKFVRIMDLIDQIDGWYKTKFETDVLAF